MFVRTASSPKYLQSKASWLHGCGMYRHRGPMVPSYKTLVNFKIPYEQMGMEINWEKRGGNQSVTAKEKSVFAMASDEWKVGVLCDCCLAENLACPRKAQRHGKRGWGMAQWTECSACRLESRGLDSFTSTVNQQHRGDPKSQCETSIWLHNENSVVPYGQTSVQSPILSRWLLGEVFICSTTGSVHTSFRDLPLQMAPIPLHLC